METRNRIIVLVEFSEYSENLVNFAFSISEIIKAKVVLVHKISGVTPAMADEGVRDGWYYDFTNPFKSGG